MYLAPPHGRSDELARAVKREDGTPADGVGSAIASCAIGLIGAWLMAAIDANATGALILTAGVAAWASDATRLRVRKGRREGAGVPEPDHVDRHRGSLRAAFRPARSAPFIVVGVIVASLISARQPNTLERVNEDALALLNTLVAAAITYGGFLPLTGE